MVNLQHQVNQLRHLLVRVHGCDVRFHHLLNQDVLQQVGLVANQEPAVLQLPEIERAGREKTEGEVAERAHYSHRDEKVIVVRHFGNHHEGRHRRVACPGKNRPHADQGIRVGLKDDFREQVIHNDAGRRTEHGADI